MEKAVPGLRLADGTVRGSRAGPMGPSRWSEGVFLSQEHQPLQGGQGRLRLALEVVPDEGVMRELEADRGRGRDDHPVRAVWNSLLAGHASVESLRRELRRNAELRELCGFDPVRGVGAVPSASGYRRFLRKLFRYERQIDGIFDGRQRGPLVPAFEPAIVSSAGRTPPCGLLRAWTRPPKTLTAQMPPQGVAIDNSRFHGI